MVGRWICPACDREFGSAHQAHLCVPGCTVDEVFSGRPPYQRAAYDRIIEHLKTLGPVHEDAVTVGVFLKADRKLAEVRPKARSLLLYLILPRVITGPLVGRAERIAAGRFGHYVKLTDPAQVDEQVKAWLTEAYDVAEER